MWRVRICQHISPYVIPTPTPITPGPPGPTIPPPRPSLTDTHESGLLYKLIIQSNSRWTDSSLYLTPVPNSTSLVYSEPRQPAAVQSWRLKIAETGKNTNNTRVSYIMYRYIKESDYSNYSTINT